MVAGDQVNGDVQARKGLGQQVQRSFFLRTPPRGNIAENPQRVARSQGAGEVAQNRCVVPLDVRIDLSAGAVAA